MNLNVSLRQDQVELLQEILNTFDGFVRSELEQTYIGGTLKACGRYTRRRIMELQSLLAEQLKSKP